MHSVHTTVQATTKEDSTLHVSVDIELNKHDTAGKGQKLTPSISHEFQYLLFHHHTGQRGHFILVHFLKYLLFSRAIS